MFGIYNSNRGLNLIDQKNYKILLFFFSGIEYILVNRDQSFSRISRERKYFKAIFVRFFNCLSDQKQGNLFLWILHFHSS